MGSSAHEANSVVAFRNFDEELKRPGIWESDQNGASTTDSSRDNLASLYRPPFALMHQGPFEKVYKNFNRLTLFFFLFYTYTFFYHVYINIF